MSRPQEICLLEAQKTAHSDYRHKMFIENHVSTLAAPLSTTENGWQHEFYSYPEELKNYIAAKNLTLEKIISQIEDDFLFYPSLIRIICDPECQVSRRALLLAYAAFDGNRRDNRDEATIHHQLRIADRSVVRLLQAGVPPTALNILVAKILGHDLIEDCKLKDSFIQECVGKNVGDGIARLSIDTSSTKGQDWKIRAAFKHELKHKQAEILLWDELLAKAEDNIDEIRTNSEDFENGLLTVSAGRVHRTRQKTSSSVEEFETKIEHRRVHQLHYARRLIDIGSIEISGIKVNLRIIASQLIQDFEHAAAVQINHLHPETLPTRSHGPRPQDRAARLAA